MLLSLDILIFMLCAFCNRIDFYCTDTLTGHGADRNPGEIYDAINRRPVIDIEDISGVRTRTYEPGGGQTVKIHEPSRGRQNIPLY